MPVKPTVLFALLMLSSLLVMVGCRMRNYGGDQPTQAAAPVVSGLRYTVQRGDTLSAIAAAHGIAVRSIVDANQLSSNLLTPGQILVLPGAVAKPVAAPVAAWFVPRSSWSQVPIQASNIDPMGVKPYRITLHHSSRMSVSPLDALGSLREIERQHMAGLGKNEPFACIGYHFIIAVDGTVYEGRPLKYQGAHSTGINNRGNIGVCLLGDFDHHAPSTAQLKSTLAVLDRFCAEYGIAAGPQTVLCHKDLKATNCPGRLFEPWVRAYAEGRIRR